MARKVAFIFPGPTYYPHSLAYQQKYLLLSKAFEGYIWTASSRSEEIRIGKFTYRSMKSDFSLLSKLKFIFFCIANGVRLQRSSNNIDLVVTYDPLISGLAGLVLAKLLKAKLIVEVNGVYTSHAQLLDMRNKIKARMKQMAFRYSIRTVLKHSDGIKLLFEDQIGPFREVVDRKLIKVFPDYVPINIFNNIKEENEVLFVGFPYKLKGVDILISAFKRVANRHRDWKLKILGWFPDPSELEKEIAGHPQIYHHPPVPYSEMPEHIGSCGIFVLPSRSEAMGRVLIEAMAAGKPRIGSNVDGIPTVINDGVDGFLFEPGNVDDLAKKLDALMSIPSLRRRLGKAAAVRAGREFAEEIYIHNLIRFYDQVIESE